MTYRTILICDECSAVGPHADSDGIEAAGARARMGGAAAGWRFTETGHQCPDCRRRAARPLVKELSA